MKESSFQEMRKFFSKKIVITVAKYAWWYFFSRYFCKLFGQNMYDCSKEINLKIFCILIGY